MAAPESRSPAVRHREDAVCLACGCLCDDVRLEVEANRITRAEPVCPLGEQWFLADRPADVPVSRIEGRPSDLESGLARAATILTAARHLLVFGLGGAPCAAQRAAAALADRLGACIDAGGENTAAMTAALQSVGMVTATLGEVRHRADLVLFWFVDPATTHPRHFDRYSLTCAGEFVPRGRADRTCLVVDRQRTATAGAADVFHQIRPEGEQAALKLLRSLAAGEADGDHAEVARQTGIDLDRWSEISERMKASQYGAIFFQPSSTTESLLLLTRELNRHARFVAMPLGSPMNPAGAQQVLAWQTGYPSAVDFAAGYPQYDLSRNVAEQKLSACQADAALVVACDPLADPLAALSESARARLASIPCVLLHTADWQPPAGAAVTFAVGSPGLATGGTVFRSDGVALPLRPAVHSPYPNAEALLLALNERV